MCGIFFKTIFHKGPWLLTDFLYNHIYSFLHILTQHKTSNKMKGYEKSEIYDFLPLGMLGPRVFLACVNDEKYKK